MLISCKVASRLISRSLDKPLSWQERLSLRFHLAICQYCREFSRQLRQLKLAAQSILQQTEHDLSIQLSPGAKARITKAIQSDL
jgi:predicted anti-sigma-YlaC factor YlaD